MLDSPSRSLGDHDAEAVRNSFALALPALRCDVSHHDVEIWEHARFTEYSAGDRSWKFTDLCLSGSREWIIVLRNSIFHTGDVFAVESVSDRALSFYAHSALCISRNIASLGEECSTGCDRLRIVAFESDSHLGEISARAFSLCRSLRSIAIPPFVRLLGRGCFSFCCFLESVMFEPRSRLAMIEESAFLYCHGLRWLCIPASVTAIEARAFSGSGVRSIRIEPGSVSFRVVHDFLVDFHVRSLIWLIGSPDSIVIPSSIERLASSCCAAKDGLRTVEFESDSSLRLIEASAFAGCKSLESVCIPSLVEVLPETCFSDCSSLRTITLHPGSKLRLVGRDALCECRSLTSVEVVGPSGDCYV
jgi:hypothetical protein